MAWYDWLPGVRTRKSCASATLARESRTSASSRSPPRAREQRQATPRRRRDSEEVQEREGGSFRAARVVATARKRPSGIELKSVRNGAHRRSFDRRVGLRPARLHRLTQLEPYGRVALDSSPICGTPFRIPLKGERAGRARPTRISHGQGSGVGGAASNEPSPPLAGSVDPVTDRSARPLAVGRRPVLAFGRGSCLCPWLSSAAASTESGFSSGRRSASSSRLSVIG